MFVIIIGIAVLVGPFYVLIKVLSGRNDPPKSEPPRTAPRRDPIDKHMDENYADIDWLRKGKL